MVHSTSMIKARGDFIGGRWIRDRTPDGEIQSLDPGDDTVVLGDFPVSASAVEQALEAARAGLPTWSELPVEERVAALQKLRAELRNRSAELTELISAETGRPAWDARDEVQAMHSGLDGWLRSALAELTVATSPPGEARVSFRPLGVAAVISPSPQPALLMHRDAVGALAAGCTVVCKASEHTPATAQLYAEIVHEADLPKGAFNLIQGDGSAGEALARSSEADVVLFSGSRGVGREVAALQSGAKAVRTLVSGNAAALVLDDALLDEAAYQIVIGACLSAGQRCNSTHRVVAHRRVLEPLADRLAALLRGLKVGHHADSPDIFMGPLISARGVKRYLTDVGRIGAGGGRELARGAPLGSRRQGFYVAPALFQLDPLTGALDLPPDEPVGPLLTLTAAADLEEAMAQVNHGGEGLVTSVFCRSRRELEQVQQLQGAGLCLQNLPTTHEPDRVPHWPAGRSGNGRPGGTLTARSCSRVVVDLEREGTMDVTMLPPGIPRTF
jgi:succinylglutamic semialdehyde dehydrogenase